MKHSMKIIRISTIVPVINYCLVAEEHDSIICPELVAVSSTTYRCKKGFNPKGNAEAVKKDPNCAKL